MCRYGVSGGAHKPAYYPEQQYTVAGVESVLTDAEKQKNSQSRNKNGS